MSKMYTRLYFLHHDTIKALLFSPILNKMHLRIILIFLTMYTHTHTYTCAKGQVIYHGPLLSSPVHLMTNHYNLFGVSYCTSKIVIR